MLEGIENAVKVGKNMPKVSIVLITYNSSDFVLETLESIKCLTYRNIELIITDDGSKDDTLLICRQWLEKNHYRFVNSEILSVEYNTGIPANCNRGVKAASGEWIKIIAGDDTFIEDGIQNFIENVNPKDRIIQTDCEIYSETFDSANYIENFSSTISLKFFLLPAHVQNKLLKTYRYINAPAVFFHGEIFEFLSFDEEFPQIEDLPFWILSTKNNLNITYLDVPTVKYRIHHNSVQTVDSNFYKNNLLQHKLISKIKSKYYGNEYNILNKSIDRVKLEFARFSLIRKILRVTSKLVKNLALNKG
ncbi:MAG: glycosyltransferase [Weeksellaceae bacterium]|nr:glycosyltransferase [Weeksellaceae bacterium]